MMASLGNDRVLKSEKFTALSPSIKETLQADTCPKRELLLVCRLPLYLLELKNDFVGNEITWPISSRSRQYMAISSNVPLMSR